MKLASPMALRSIFSRLAVRPPVPPLHGLAVAPNAPRHFSTTRPAFGNWLEPNIDRTKKMKKGRPRVPTGGSTKGTTVIWGDFGLRLRDHHRRISAQQLKLAEETIKNRLRGQKFRLYKRVCCNVGVYTSGNDLRMGKGKGSFDHWATRMAVSQVVFELKGMIHEKVAAEALRLAGHKLPGQWDFIKKGEPAKVGITSLKDTTLEELKRPRRKLNLAELVKASPSTVITEGGVVAGTPPSTATAESVVTSTSGPPPL